MCSRRVAARGADLKLMLRQLRTPGGSVSVMPEGIAGAPCWQRFQCQIAQPEVSLLAVRTGVNARL